MRQIRLLIVIDGFFIGGTETQILSAIPHLQDRGIHVVVVGRDGPLTQAYRKTGCTIYHLNFPLDESVHALHWRDLENQLMNIIEKENIDIVHSHQITSARFTSLAVRKFNVPMFFSVHGTYSNIANIRAILNNQGNVISVSPAIHEWLLKNRIPSTMIPNGISLDDYRPMERYDARKTYGLALDEPVIVYAGRLAWEKADICMRLMDACTHLRRECFPDMKLIVAGGGSGAETVKKYGTNLQDAQRDEFMTFLGEQTEMNRVFALANCVVGTGRVALEAMACQRPVVAAGSKGMFGLVLPENFDLALQYHFGDHKADRPITATSLAVPIAVVLSCADFQASLGFQGRQFVESRFNVRDLAQEFVQLYSVAVG